MARGKSSLNGILSPLLRRIRFAKILKYIPANSRILDIGCDSAKILESLKGFKKYTGIDTAEDIILLNKKRYSARNIVFKLMAAAEVGLLSDSYDVVLMAALIEHLPDFEKILINLWPICSDQGIIIITTPKKTADLILKFGSLMRIFARESNESHVRYYSRNDFIGLTGWKLEKYTTFELGINQLLVLKKQK